jgi:hypothetical protein
METNINLANIVFSEKKYSETYVAHFKLFSFNFQRTRGARVNVMITIFGDFHRFSAKKSAFVLKTML